MSSCINSRVSTIFDVDVQTQLISTRYFQDITEEHRNYRELSRYWLRKVNENPQINVHKGAAEIEYTIYGPNNSIIMYSFRRPKYNKRVGMYRIGHHLIEFRLGYFARVSAYRIPWRFKPYSFHNETIFYRHKKPKHRSQFKAYHIPTQQTIEFTAYGPLVHLYLDVRTTRLNVYVYCALSGRRIKTFKRDEVDKVIVDGNNLYFGSLNNPADEYKLVRYVPLFSPHAESHSYLKVVDSSESNNSESDSSESVNDVNNINDVNVIDTSVFSPHSPIIVEDLVSNDQKRKCIRDTTGKQITCCVCFEDAASYVAIPCGHSDYCNLCNTKLSACAVCRTKVEKFVKLF